MKKTERLDEATAPDGTVLTLYRHDGEYYILAAGNELMSTRRHHSEERLAQLACAGLEASPGTRVLIGGLGFGFTLRSVLDLLQPDAEVVVVELLEQVLAWNRNPEYGLAAAALADSRVSLLRDDVANVLANRVGQFDAIMLDVDNGAESFTTEGNARLYDAAGIATSVAALRPDGVLAYWLDRPDRAFETRLRRTGLVVEATRVSAHAKGGAVHAVVIARRAVRSSTIVSVP